MFNRQEIGGTMAIGKLSERKPAGDHQKLPRNHHLKNIISFLTKKFSKFLHWMAVWIVTLGNVPFFGSKTRGK
jgi:hypothetical protein